QCWPHLSSFWSLSPVPLHNGSERRVTISKHAKMNRLSVIVVSCGCLVRCGSGSNAGFGSDGSLVRPEGDGGTGGATFESGATAAPIDASAWEETAIDANLDDVTNDSGP